MRRALSAIGVVFLLCSIAGAADSPRRWQRGTWSEVKITRPKIVIGVQPKLRPGQTPPAMTLIRTYVIDTEDLRLELKEPSPPPRRSVEAMVGHPVTFALEKNTLYVRDDDGTEHRLQITKRQERGSAGR
jgi:hypothetical protein